MKAIQILIKENNCAPGVDIFISPEPPTPPDRLHETLAGRAAITAISAMQIYLSEQQGAEMFEREFGIPAGNFYLLLDKSERDTVLMALAHLAVERPGWDHMLEEIAAKLERRGEKGRVPTFEEFKRMFNPLQLFTSASGDGVQTDRYRINPDLRSIVCLKCGRTSFNLNDVREKYCGFCHVFHEDPKLTSHE